MVTFRGMADTQKLQQVHTALKKKFSNRKLVFGMGAIGSKIVLVTDHPGQDGAKEGKPIAGDNGKLLNKLLRSAGIDVKNVYFTNVIKYHPKDKKPASKEIRSYVPFLKEEIRMVGPKVVVTLGDTALNSIGLRQPLSNVHGKTFNFGSYTLIPTFHPEMAAKDPEIQMLLVADLSKLKKIVAEAEKEQNN
ncbi:MAG: uracil-DNA glycosylase [Patescibacteria group bacterium]